MDIRRNANIVWIPGSNKNSIGNLFCNCSYELRLNRILACVLG